jgi:hypothetical protein
VTTRPRNGVDWRDRVHRARRPGDHAPRGLYVAADAAAPGRAHDSGTPPAGEPIVGDPEPEAPRPGAAHEECYACPVGGFFAAAHKIQPDARSHLLHAVHELIGVARALLDAADSVVAHQQRRAPEPDAPAPDGPRAARGERAERGEGAAQSRARRPVTNPRLRSIRID